MGMMTKMRDNAHVFIIAFAVVFVAFWVVSDVDISSLMQGSMNELGNINGRSISYQEFQAVVEQVAEQRRQQNNGRELTENDYMQVREQVWNDFVTQAVVDKAIADLGIKVYDEEITAWINGPNPPQALTQYFVDSTGTFNREAYSQFLRNPGKENQAALIQLENQLKSELIRGKLTDVLAASIVIPEEELKHKFIEQNVEFSASYVFFDPRVFASSDTTAPTDEEFKAYYEQYKQRFKIDEMRTLRYVVFPDVPSAGDSAAIRNELSTVLELANNGSDFMELVKQNSEVPYSDQWYSRDRLPQEASGDIFSQPVGSVIGPLPTETGFSIYKILEEREGEAVLYHASHILMRTDGGQDDAAQKKKAEEVLAKAKGGTDFSALAKQYSEEPGAAERGGDLGWFGKGRMVPEFENAVVSAKAGQIVGPVKSQFGYHVIKVLGRSQREFKLAEIRMSVKVGSRTRDEIFERARNFAYFANENGFDSEAKLDGFQVMQTPEFAQQSTSYIPGIGTNPALLKFAFENKVGTISEVHRSANGYAVAIVDTKRDAGYRALDDELKTQLRAQVVFERQINKTMAIAKNVASGTNSLEALASKKPSLAVVNTPPFKISNGVPNIGPDQAFVGTLLSLKPNQVSQPVRGLRGPYVIRLDSRSNFDDAAFKVKKQDIRNQELQSRQNEFIQSWLEQKRQEIDISDNRDRFFR